MPDLKLLAKFPDRVAQALLTSPLGESLNDEAVGWVVRVYYTLLRNIRPVHRAWALRVLELMARIELSEDVQSTLPGVQPTVQNGSGTPKSTPKSVQAHVQAHVQSTYESSSFEQFWSNYPKRRNKKRAFDSWKKLQINQELLDRILQAIREQKTWDEWTKAHGQFVPLPSTWLNGAQWNDEAHVHVPEPAPVPAQGTGANVGPDGFTAGGPHGIWVKDEHGR